MKLYRRHFLQSLAAAPLAASAPRFAFAADPSNSVDGDILVVVFQRGGADGLSLIVPHGDPDYYRDDLRPTLAVPPPETGTGSAIDLDGLFGLHPELAPLKPIYDSGVLAVVHATGSPHETRSHFDAQDFMERAYLEKNGITTGWIGRHLETAGGDDGSPFQAVGMGGTVQTALRGEVPAVAISTIDAFRLAVPELEAPALERALADLHDGADALDIQARQALDALDLIALADPGQYPPENGAVYPDSPFGQSLLQVGQLIKAESLGLRAVCVDIGGWDTHDRQNQELPSRIADLAAGLAAFHTDLGGLMDRVVVVTLSEFGRRAGENASGGTDHGHGNCMLAMGGGVNGARVYADWPGLDVDDLHQNRDLRITTDWRTVLGELVAKRLGNSHLETVFPDFRMPDFPGIFRTL